MDNFKSVSFVNTISWCILVRWPDELNNYVFYYIHVYFWFSVGTTLNNLNMMND